ncbi:MAG: transposase, partial [Solirubrobacterales bacterium]|nr:transposase [Solirubrobacterales bacterium]
HLGWKVALGLAIDHAGFHPTTMVKFRARLLLHGKERLALERTLELATELGLMKGAVEQIVDSTPMLGAAATQDTVTLVRSGVAKLIGAVEAAEDEAATELRNGLEFDYERPRQKPDCDWRSRQEREAMLTRVAQDAERGLRAVEAAPQLLDDEAVAESHRLLRELIGQDFDVSDDGVPRLHRGTRAGRILSVHDPEMRHGRKSRRQRFDGYKLHAAATNAPQPLITAVEVESASEHDGPQAKRLVDSQPQARRPKRILGDTAYGNQDVRDQMAEREIEVLAPVASSKVHPVFGKEEFEIDLDAGTVTCPQGKVARISKPHRNGKRGASFRRADCRPCPLRVRCTSQDHRQVKLGRREDLLIAARMALDDPEAAEHLRRTRPRVERLIGMLAHRYGARKSRYKGKRKARLQAAWTAALVNLNPIGNTLTAATA